MGIRREMKINKVEKGTERKVGVRLKRTHTHTHVLHNTRTAHASKETKARPHTHR